MRRSFVGLVGVCVFVSCGGVGGFLFWLAETENAKVLERRRLYGWPPTREERAVEPVMQELRQLRGEVEKLRQAVGEAPVTPEPETAE